jgi:succinyl-diaminopimelate desuccinylase
VDEDRLLEALDKHLKRPDRVVALQTALTACKAMGPENGGRGEMEKARLIAGWLKDSGLDDLRWENALDTRVPDGARPNLVAVLPGRSDRTLWLFGHLDVVPPGDIAAWTSDPWQVRQEGDRLYGRGVVDNQQAIVSMLLLAKELRAQKITPPLSLGLVFMSDEECGSDYGLGHLLARDRVLFRADDLYIVPDSGSPRGDILQVAEKGQLWLQVRVTGKQCHAAWPHEGRNAFLAGADMALSCHKRLHEAFPEEDPLFVPPGSTFVPGKHEANVPNINTVPGSDVFYMDCRLLPGISAAAVLEEARNTAAQAAQRWGVAIDVRVEREQASSASPLSCPIVGLLTDAVERVYNVRPKPVGIGGATVAALLRHKGLHAVVWSTLESTCHQPDEYCSISATVKDAQVFARILMSDYA